jgi:hypothetical protein
MSKVFFTALFLSSSVALADCPDLAGNYICEVDNQSFELNITQAVNSDGHTVYSNDQFDIIADGKEHTFTIEDMTETYTATCSGASMLYKYSDVYKDGYIEAGENKFTKKGNQMLIEVDGDTVTCSK